MERFGKRQWKSGKGEWKDRTLRISSTYFGTKSLYLRLKTVQLRPVSRFLAVFHTPLAQVSNTSFIDRICKIKVKIKKDKVQTKIVGYEKGVNSIHTEESKF